LIANKPATSAKNDSAAFAMIRLGAANAPGATVASQDETTINKKGEIVAGGTTRTGWDDTFDSVKDWIYIVLAWILLPPIIGGIMTMFPATAPFAGYVSKCGLLSIIGSIMGLFKKKEEKTIVDSAGEALVEAVKKVADTDVSEE
jgi:hypothetical protein